MDYPALVEGLRRAAEVQAQLDMAEAAERMLDVASLQLLVSAAGMILLLLTVVQGYRMLAQAQAQLAHAVLVVTHQQRPRLLLSRPRVKPFSANDHIEIDVPIKNTGQTSARKLVLRRQAKVLKPASPARMPSRDRINHISRPTEQRIAVLMPDQTCLARYRPKQGGQPIGEELHSQISRGERVIVILLECEWQDGDSEPHSCRRSWVMWGPNLCNIEDNEAFQHSSEVDTLPDRDIQTVAKKLELLRRGGVGVKRLFRKSIRKR